MNYKKIIDSIVSFSWFKILDARYERAYCKKTGKGGSAMKQQIPNRYLAVKYAYNADINLYKAYIDGNPNVKHPHYTAAYYCPWCDAWHLTTSPWHDTQESLEEECQKAKAQGNPLDNCPENGPLFVEFHFPDYTPEQIQAYFDRFTKSPQERRAD